MLYFANTLLSSLAVLSQLLIVISLLLLVFSFGNFKKIFQKYLAGQRAIILAFAVSLVATLGSLFYSQIAHFVPCEFCWYQRIFMYPQVVLLAVALYKKEDAIVDYALTLAGIGTIFSLYHNNLVYGSGDGAVCSLTGVSCAIKYVTGYNYITIPLMALTAFASIILLLFGHKLAPLEVSKK